MEKNSNNIENFVKSMEMQAEHEITMLAKDETFFDELEKLKQQKKEIEERIKFLRNKTVGFGSVKIEKVNYAGYRESEWVVSVKRKSVDYEEKERYSQIIKAHDKQKAIDEIDKVISDLQCLRDKLKGEN